MTRLIVASLLCVFQLPSAPAIAADSDIAVTMRAFKVAASATGTELLPTDKALPGDTIEYHVVYRNTGRAAVRNVTATLPVPAGGMAFVPESARPAAVTASVDGKSFAAVPLQRVVVRDGRSITEAVPASEYRFLRWQLGELAAGQSATVQSRMRLAAGDPRPR